MTKIEFILKLKDRLSGLPQDEVDDRLLFYSETIDDLIEEGISEEYAVRDMGSIDDVASQILADTPLLKIVKDKVKSKRRMRAWEIVLLAVGSPLWIALLAVAFALLITVYAVIWSLVVSAWAVFVTFAATFIGGIAGGVLFICFGDLYAGLACIAAGLVLAGLSIFTFFGCIAATKGCARLTKVIMLGIKRGFVGKERA
jgi:uncharacterized membrane protein